MCCVSVAHAENLYLLSLATGVAPRYEGSRDYRPVVGPVLAAQFGNGFFISSADGAGYRKQFSNGLFVSAALGYAMGRTDENRFNGPGSDYLKGMGNIPGSLLVSVQAGVRLFGSSTFSVTLDQPVTHTTRGISGHVDLTMPIVHAGNDNISVTGTLHAGSGRYTQTFFGVTAAQAARSRFQPYSAKGGFDQATMSVAWTHMFSPRWSLNTTVGMERLIGSSRDSPIVQKQANWFGLTSITYRY
ncbi:MipA/OmpV family protein [Cupriavidus sp. HMR-1]|uniref:MipA/OmpV family protein n=1 Tax=Cupriavidus sp. HMR-1 TaxID=1249621 RepID=UPI0005874C0D|nr:MipA/OmpV family protein [Cupriavidus sp. HMR-1]